MKNRKAFTLIELLVVVSIIALLLSILMPALGSAKRQARKVLCATNIRQCGLGAMMAAEDDSRNKLPQAGVHRDNYDFDDSISIEFKELLKIGSVLGDATLSDDATQNLDAARDSGTSMMKSGAMDIFTCPEIDMKEYSTGGVNDIILKKRVYRLPYIHWLGTDIVARIGYNYYGGFETHKWPEPLPEKAVKWDSADKLSDSGQCVIMSDRTRWVPDPGGWAPFEITEVPHTKKGFVWEYATDMDPRDLPGAGGNVGYLDGSVSFLSYNDNLVQPRQVVQIQGKFDHGDYSFF